MAEKNNGYGFDPRCELCEVVGSRGGFPQEFKCLRRGYVADENTVLRPDDFRRCSCSDHFGCEIYKKHTRNRKY